MKCVCPECGHVAGMTAFAAEADARECMGIAMQMPRPLADSLMRYLSLFRPAKQALRWSRALKLLRELHTDIERGRITRKGRDWVAPQQAWQDALATVLEQRHTLTLPLADHAYLYEIIRRGANSAEAKTEQQREDTRRKRSTAPRAQTPYDDPSLGAKPAAGSLKAALAQARSATESPAKEDTDQ